jgi:hypothetical protein
MQNMKWSREVLVSGFVLAFAVFAPSFPALRAQVFGTNDLWLEIALTNNVAAFTIHAPATNANGVYDLYFNTNPTDNQNWTWWLRNGPGQTNLAVTNLPPGQGFFRLGVTNAIRSGFDQQILDRNDDGSTGIVPMGFFINYFGSSNATLYVNNNGNVTFDGAQSTYTPSALNSLKSKIIAPYWADVDTRNTTSDVVKYGTNMVDGHVAFGVDWVNVGYYNDHADKLLSCQLVIINRSDIAPGDFDMEFNYFKVQWETGDASGGFDGLGGYSARAGYASVSGSTFELDGSGVPGSFLDANVVTGLIYQSLNSSVPGRYFFSFRNGEPLP